MRPGGGDAANGNGDATRRKRSTASTTSIMHPQERSKKNGAEAKPTIRETAHKDHKNCHPTAHLDEANQKMIGRMQHVRGKTQSWRCAPQKTLATQPRPIRESRRTAQVRIGEPRVSEGSRAVC